MRTIEKIQDGFLKFWLPKPGTIINFWDGEFFHWVKRFVHWLRKKRNYDVREKILIIGYSREFRELDRKILNKLHFLGSFGPDEIIIHDTDFLELSLFARPFMSLFWLIPLLVIGGFIMVIALFNDWMKFITRTL